MSDLISRQEAIEAMCGVLMGLFDCSLSYAYKVVEDALENLPSAEPRKKGKWLYGYQMQDYPRIPYKIWKLYCSECGEETIDLYDFCPNCGSYNGGEEE